MADKSYPTAGGERIEQPDGSFVDSPADLARQAQAAAAIAKATPAAPAAVSPAAPAPAPAEE